MRGRRPFPHPPENADHRSPQTWRDALPQSMPNMRSPNTATWFPLHDWPPYWQEMVARSGRDGDRNLAPTVYALRGAEDYPASRPAEARPPRLVVGSDE